MTFQILIILLIIILLLSICLIILNSINLNNKKLGGVKNNILKKYGGTMEMVKAAVDKLISAYREKKSEKAKIEQEKNDIEQERDKLTLELTLLKKELRQAKIKPIKQNISFDNTSKRPSEYYGNELTTEGNISEVDNHLSFDNMVADKDAQIKTYKDTIEHQNADIKNYQNAIDGYKRSNIETDKRIEDKEKSIKKLSTKIKELSKMIELQDEEILKKDNELGNLAEEIKKLEDEISGDNLIKSEIIADIENALKEDDNI